MVAIALKSEKGGETDEELGLSHLVENGSAPAEGVVRPKVSFSFSRLGGFSVGIKGVEGGERRAGRDATRRAEGESETDADISPFISHDFHPQDTQLSLVSLEVNGIVWNEEKTFEEWWTEYLGPGGKGRPAQLD